MTRLPDPASGACFGFPSSPWLPPFSPGTQQELSAPLFAPFIDTMAASDCFACSSQSRLLLSSSPGPRRVDSTRVRVPGLPRRALPSSRMRTASVAFDRRESLGTPEDIVFRCSLGLAIFLHRTMPCASTIALVVGRLSLASHDLRTGLRVCGPGIRRTLGADGLAGDLIVRGSLWGAFQGNSKCKILAQFGNSPRLDEAEQLSTGL